MPHLFKMPKVFDYTPTEPDVPFFGQNLGVFDFRQRPGKVEHPTFLLKNGTSRVKTIIFDFGPSSTSCPTSFLFKNIFD